MFCATNSSTACSSSNNLTKPYARANCFTFLSSYFFAFLSLIGEVRRWGSGEESSYLENNFVESVLCHINCNFFEWIWKINSSSYLRVSLVQYSASGSVNYRHQSTVIVHEFWKWFIFVLLKYTIQQMVQRDLTLSRTLHILSLYIGTESPLYPLYIPYIYTGSIWKFMRYLPLPNKFWGDGLLNGRTTFDGAHTLCYLIPTSMFLPVVLTNNAFK